MSDSTDTPAADAPTGARKRGGGLSSLLLADLKAMAGGLGIPGAGAMKKAQLVEAIKAVQAGAPSGRQTGGTAGGSQTAAPTSAAAQPAERPRVTTRTRGRAAAAPADEQAGRTEAPRAGASTAGSEAAQPAQATEPGGQQAAQEAPQGGDASRRTRSRRGDQPVETREDEQQAGASREGGDRGDQQARRERRQRDERGQDGSGRDGSGKDGSGKDAGRERGDQRARDRQQGDKQDRQDQQSGRQERQDRQDRQDRQSDKQDRHDQQSGKQDRQDKQDRHDQQSGKQQSGNQGQQDQHDDDEDGRGRNRRRRGRERTRPGSRNEPDTTVLEDDVLVPAAGILDVLDNYAFVRTTSYLPGPDDVYLSLSMVRRFGLRRGDAIVGQVRQPREGERKEKFNPMVRVESVNGADPEAARDRVEFSRLTPVHPTERLRLETGAADVAGRIVDLVAPIGKGQRGLIVSPAKAGKTTLLQSIAASITANNPECHLMVVLVDERPEEVTDFERSVKGEVISSTFDRPPADHAVVAELAIERAKRLVELGHDVVVLLDGITRLGRAYNLASPAGGRILAGGVDSTALYPPKRFFGAARNIENGGSLTIVATALVESGSSMDEVIFEEFTGTSNMELRLRRDLADAGLFPAIDLAASGTRHAELLFSPEEAAVVATLRRELATQGEHQAMELLLQRLGTTQSNVELLMQVQRTAAGRDA